MQTCSLCRRKAAAAAAAAVLCWLRTDTNHIFAFCANFSIGIIPIVSIDESKLSSWHHLGNFTTLSRYPVTIAPPRTPLWPDCIGMFSFWKFRMIWHHNYLTWSGAQMIQLRCLRLTLRRYGKITKIKIRSLCVGAANQLMLFGIQKCERLWARTICVHTHLEFGVAILRFGPILFYFR